MTTYHEGGEGGGGGRGTLLSLLNHVKYEHLIAGVTGGVTSTLILHPLDLIKIRFAGNI
jgi:solute carrier family 25 folate transporter 32